MHVALIIQAEEEISGVAEEVAIPEEVREALETQVAVASDVPTELPVSVKQLTLNSKGESDDVSSEVTVTP